MGKCPLAPSPGTLSPPSPWTPPLRCDSSRVWDNLAVPGSHLESLEIMALFQEPPCGMLRRGKFNKLPK